MVNRINGCDVATYNKNVRFVRSLLDTMVTNGLISDYWVDPYIKTIVNSLPCSMGLTSNRYILRQATMRCLCDPRNIPQHTMYGSCIELIDANRIIYSVCVMHLLGYGIKVMVNELCTTEEEIHYAIDIIRNNKIIDWK